MKDLKIKNNNVILYNFLIKKISIWDSSFGHNLTYYLHFERCLNFPTLLYTSFTVQWIMLDDSSQTLLVIYKSHTSYECLNIFIPHVSSLLSNHLYFLYLFSLSYVESRIATQWISTTLTP